MKSKSLKEIAAKMRKLDFCMMTTQDGRGTLHSRPMSNNGEVDFDGTCWFYSYQDTAKVRHLEQSSIVSLCFQGNDMLFVHLYGSGSVLTQKAKLAEHWDKSLDSWFPQGIDTPGICLIQVVAKKVQYWHKADEGEWSM